MVSMATQIRYHCGVHIYMYPLNCVQFLFGSLYMCIHSSVFFSSFRLHCCYILCLYKEILYTLFRTMTTSMMHVNVIGILLEK